MSKFLARHQCTKCGVTGGWFRKFKGKTGKFYYYRECAKCRAGYQRQWRKGRSRKQIDQNNEYMRAYRKVYAKQFPEKYFGSRQWRLLHPVEGLWVSLKARAHGKGKQKVFLIGLTRQEFLDEIGKMPKRCPVLGIPIKLGKRFFNGNSPSVDRIDCRRPYEKGNIAIISYRANAIKRDGTADEHRKIAAWMDKMARKKRP